jgi:uncharacterized protein YndB with AHSA1/START domain
VWQALADASEFGTWFRVALEGAFTAGTTCRGKLTYPGYEHLAVEIQVERLEAGTCFAFRWHPYAVDPQVDYASEQPTLVEFHLEEAPGGTRVRLVESGFDGIPEGRRAEAYRMNTGGWVEQLGNLGRHLGG